MDLIDYNTDQALDSNEATRKMQSQISANHFA